MKRIGILASLITSSVTIVLCGCRSHDSVAAARIIEDPIRAASLADAARSVVPIRREEEDGYFVATAFSVGGGQFMTNRHNLPAEVLAHAFLEEVAVEIDGRRIEGAPLFELGVNGERVLFKLIARGATEAPEDDWALIESVSPRLDIPAIPTLDGRAPEPGDEAVLLGYWEEVPEGELAVIPGTIGSPPLFPWFPFPDGLIVVETGSGSVYHGISGGPLLVWDEVRQGEGGYAAVGVYRGMRQWRGLGEWKKGVQTAVPLSSAVGSTD